MEIRIEGAVAGEAARALQDAFGAGELSAIEADGTVSRVIDPAKAMAAAGLLLALPGAILAGMEIEERLSARAERRAKAEQAIQTAQQFRDNHGTVIIVNVGGQSQMLADLNIDQLIDLAAKDRDANADK